MRASGENTAGGITSYPWPVWPTIKSIWHMQEYRWNPVDSSDTFNYANDPPGTWTSCRGRDPTDSGLSTSDRYSSVIVWSNRHKCPTCFPLRSFTNTRTYFRSCTLKHLFIQPFCSLAGCQITGEGCAALASVLRSNPAHLRELDLSFNCPGDFGLQLLTAVLHDPRCRLETLR